MLSLFGPNSCSDIDDSISMDGVMFQYKEKKDGKLTHPFTITHPHLTLASSPNGIYTSKQLMSTANFKAFGNDEKDLGIGTSSEDSSENSSSKSQRRKAIDDENVRRRYEMGWRKSSQTLSTASPCTFQPALDIYGNKYDDFWNSAENISNAKRCNSERARNDMQMCREIEADREKEVIRNDESIIRKKHPDYRDSKNEKRLSYYDYNQQQKPADSSFRNGDRDAPRKYITTRRNIV